MKKIAIIGLVLVTVLGLCACRMGQNEETTPTTEPATEPPATTVPEPSIVDPTVFDPTLAPNVPDPGVDDDHLIDPTQGNGETEGGSPDTDGRLT